MAKGITQETWDANNSPDVIVSLTAGGTETFEWISVREINDEPINALLDVRLTVAGTGEEIIVMKKPIPRMNWSFEIPWGNGIRVESGDTITATLTDQNAQQLLNEQSRTIEVIIEVI